MRRRNAAVRKERNLDRYVQEDEAPKITLADSDVVDWISTSHLVRPDPPSLNRVEWGTTDTPLYNNNEGGWYKILCIGEGNLIIFASEAVYLNNTMGAPGGQQNRSWLYVNVPVGPPGTVRRDLYRLPDQIQGAITYYLIARVAGNTAEAVVEDPFGPAWLYNNPAHGEMPPVPAEAEGPRTVYYRMNEDTNAWEVLVEGVQASPTGNILDVWPSLAFTPHNMSGDASESQRATMIFFGNEINAELVRSAYAEMFATRRKITFRAKGMDYRIGDEIFFYNDSRFAKYGTMLIKRVAIRPLEETTHITAFTYGWL
jgi:hypothetical protein